MELTCLLCDSRYKFVRGGASQNRLRSLQGSVADGLGSVESWYLNRLNRLKKYEDLYLLTGA